MSLTSTTAEILAEPSDATLRGPDGTENITVWSKPSCVQCNATYRKLDSLGIEYRVENLEERPDKLEEFKAQGMMHAPIVVVPRMEIWCGYRPDLIDQLANEFAADRLLLSTASTG